MLIYGRIIFMSSAFRNFILTLVLMTAVLGFVAWKLVPKFEDVVLKPVFNSDVSVEPEISVPDESTPSDVSDTVSDTSDVSTPPATENDTVFDCLFFTKNSKGHICSVVYAYASQQKNNYVICNLPVDMYLSNGDQMTPLYELIGSKSVDYAVKKISAIIGHDVKYYAFFKNNSISQITTLKNDITFDIPYDIKYLDPDFASIPEDQRNDSHYITIKAGKKTLNSSNIMTFFNCQRDEKKVEYSLQQSMMFSVVKQLFSDQKFSTDLVSQKKLHGYFDTNIPYNEFSELSDLIFSFKTAKQSDFTYPTYTGFGNYIVPDWESGISEISKAMSNSK